MFRISIALILATSSVFAQHFTAWTYAGAGQPLMPVAGVNASIGSPLALATDSAGNLYFDAGESLVKLSPSGLLTRVLGNGRAGVTEDGVPALAANFSGTAAIATDTAGNIYFANREGNSIRKIDSNGIVNTIAGTGTA